MGTFWAEINEDPTVSSYLHCQILMARQMEQDLKELKGLVSRDKTPLYHRQLLQPLTFNDNKDLTFMLPENVVNIGTITEKLLSPEMTLIKTSDFTIEDGKITFDKKLLDYPIKITYEFSNGDMATYITIWAHDVDYDVRYLERRWGCQVGVKGKSSEQYRKVLNQTYQQLIHG